MLTHVAPDMDGLNAARAARSRRSTYELGAIRWPMKTP
jgi:hypothetical protein